MSPTLRSYFNDYATYHRTSGNQACHYVGIPLIVLALFALLAQVTLGSVAGYTINLAMVVLAVVTVYYLTLDVALALLMLVIAAAMIAVGARLTPLWATGIFVVGWIFQYVGHLVYEKKSPAFYKNFVHLLVGPLWILAKAFGRA